MTVSGSSSAYQTLQRLRERRFKASLPAVHNSFRSNIPFRRRLTVSWTDLSILRAAIHPRYIHIVEPKLYDPPRDDHDLLRCVQGVACFELGVRANAQVQLQGNQIGAAAKPPQSADRLSAATICRVAWSTSREAVVPRE